MKTLKITIAFAAVLLLTVSGVKSDTVVNTSDQPTYENNSNFDLLATSKTKVKKPANG